MPSKKDIYGNWTEKKMCGDYKRINKFTKSDRYAMPTPEENFEAIGHAKVFSTLDLRLGYHQIGLREEDTLSVEVPTIWIEECTCRVSKSHG
jgi:hypothetical protein